MKKYFYIVISCLVGTAAIGAVLVDNTVYASYVVRTLRAAAHRSGIRIAVTEPRLSFFGIRAESLQVAPQRVPLWLTLENIQTYLPIFRLITFSPVAKFDGSAYSGTIAGTVSLTNSQIPPEISAKDLSLSEHPQLLGLGIQSGALSFELSGNEDGSPISATVALRNVSKPLSTKLPRSITNSPLPIAIPGFSELRLDSSLQLSDSKLYVKSFTSSSSLGTADCGGEIQLTPNGQVADMKLQGSVTLTEDGNKELGGIVSLLSGGRLKSTDTAFTFLLRGPPEKPVYQLSPLTG